MITNKKTSLEFDSESVLSMLNPSEYERAEAWAYLIDNEIKLNGWMKLQKEEIVKKKIITKTGDTTVIDWTQTHKIN
jgi:hypothetical protein